MKQCIYCRKMKEEDEFSLEHVISQFLGGAYSPDTFKIKDVCARCNGNLGLFVDAGFEKNFLVSSYLRDNGYSFFDPTTPAALPLICMGPSDLAPPQMKDDEICECWLGPLGEQIYWIRPKDNRLYWYMGGNPRTTKTVESTAYFLFSERSPKNLLLSCLTFRDAFEGRPVKKVLCTIANGINISDIGFSKPGAVDTNRIDYFHAHCLGGEIRHFDVPIYTHFDTRFLAKISIGVAYSLFGGKVLLTSYADELHKALWYKEGDAMPAMKGVSALESHGDDRFKGLTGESHGVTLIVQRLQDAIALNLNIAAKLVWTVRCASCENLTRDDFERIGEGKVIVLFKPLRKSVALDLPEYIAHKSGVRPNLELVEINARADRYKDYFSKL